MAEQNRHHCAHRQRMWQLEPSWMQASHNRARVCVGCCCLTSIFLQCVCMSGKSGQLIEVVCTICSSCTDMFALRKLFHASCEVCISRQGGYSEALPGKLHMQSSYLRIPTRVSALPKSGWPAKRTVDVTTSSHIVAVRWIQSDSCFCRRHLNG